MTNGECYMAYDLECQLLQLQEAQEREESLMTGTEVDALDRWAAETMGWKRKSLRIEPQYVWRDDYWVTDSPHEIYTSLFSLHHTDVLVLTCNLWQPTRNPDQAHLFRRWMEGEGWNSSFGYTVNRSEFCAEFYRWNPSREGVGFSAKEGLAILLAGQSAMGDEE